MFFSIGSTKSLLIGSLILAIWTRSSPQPGAFSEGRTAPSTDAGQIIGKVRLEGPYQKPPSLKVNKNREFCGDEVPNESLLVGPGGGLQNTVIIVHVPRQEKTAARLITLDNKNCAFVPRVQVASPGSEVLLLNSDPILHDAHARLGRETLFNVGLPAWRQVKKLLDREGLIKVECDVLHTWQSAYIVVTSSPYFAVTDEKGEFVINGVPPGNHAMEVWHETLGGQSKTVAVIGHATTRVDFAYRQF